METCCESLNCILKTNKLNFLGCEWMNWNNKLKSGLLLASMNLFFLSMLIFDLSFLSVLAYLLMFYLLAGIVTVKVLGTPKTEER